MSLTVTVLGTPAPQGSKRHVGRGVMVESSEKVKPWREAVKWAFSDYTHADGAPGILLTGPVRVDLVFTLIKPRSAPKTRRTWPAKRPDLDKLIRSTLDGLTDSGVIRDDAQIVTLTAAKRYPSEGARALSTPGAWICITDLSADELDRLAERHAKTHPTRISATPEAT